MSRTQERADRQREDREAAQRDAKRLEECGRLEGVVAAGVMRALGQPANFLRVSARLISPNTYRVNVFIGPHVASAKVAHSFFVAADNEGKLLSSNPPVKKMY